MFDQFERDEKLDRNKELKNISFTKYQMVRELLAVHLLVVHVLNRKYVQLAVRAKTFSTLFEENIEIKRLKKHRKALGLCELISGDVT